MPFGVPLFVTFSAKHLEFSEKSPIICNDKFNNMLNTEDNYENL